MKKISTKLTLIFLAVSTLIGLVSGISMYSQSYNLLTSTGEQRVTATLNVAALILEEALLDVQQLSLTMDTYLRTSVSEVTDLNDSASLSLLKAELFAMMPDLIQSHRRQSGWIVFNSQLLPGAHTVSLFEMNGQLEREPEYDVYAEGYYTQDWWVQAIVKGDHWTTPYYWEPWQTDVISYSKAVVINDQVLAVCGAELFLNPLLEDIEGVNTYHKGAIQLLAPDGTWINPDLTLDQLANLKVLVASSQFENNENVMINDEALWPSPVIWKSLSNGWRVIVMPHRDEVYVNVSKLTGVASLTFFTALVLALILSYVLSHRISKPLVQLSTAVEGFLSKQERIKLPKAGNDELGRLITSIDALEKKVEKAIVELELSRAQYVSIFEQAGQMMFTLDLDKKFLMINSAMLKRLRLNKAEVIGQGFEHLAYPQDIIQVWKSAFDQTLATREAVSIDFNLTNPEGITYHFVLTLIPVVSPTDRILMVVGNVSDITEVIAAQNEVAKLLKEEKQRLETMMALETDKLKKAMHELMQSEKMASLGRLVAGVAHEINTPLGTAITISSFIQQEVTEVHTKLAENQLTKGEFEKLITTLEESSDTLNKSLDKAATLISSFKSISAHQTSTQIETFDLCKSVRDEFTSLHHEYQSLGVKAKIVGPESLMVTTYPSAIIHVLTHLLLNALMHAFSKVKAPEIRVVIAEEGDNVLITVSDNGRGMSEEVIKNAFEPFYTTKFGQGGNGLGLSIVYNTVTSILRGTISLKSKVHEGTTISITMKKTLIDK